MLQTKNGIMGFINSQLDFEKSESQTKLWEQKLNKENVIVWLKNGGSKHNKNQPYVRVEAAFKSFYNMYKLIETVILFFLIIQNLQIFSTQHRRLWDKDVLAYDITPLDDYENVYLNYQQNKSPIGSNKDFLDKQIQFSQNGELYVYYSSIPDDTNIKPIQPKTDRAQTIVGLGKIYRREDDDMIIYSMLMQCDLKIKITPVLIGMFLPKGMLEWSKKVNKYINDNYENI